MQSRFTNVRRALTAIGLPVDECLRLILPSGLVALYAGERVAEDPFADRLLPVDERPCLHRFIEAELHELNVVATPKGVHSRYGNCLPH